MCDNQKIDIECLAEDEFDCEIEISDKLESKNIKMSGDKMRSLGIFNKGNKSKLECTSRYKICNYEINACSNYKNSFKFILEREIRSHKDNSERCDLLNELKRVGDLSNEMIAGNVFKKSDCSDSSNSSLKTLQFKLGIVQKNMSLSLSNSDNFFNSCLIQYGDRALGVTKEFSNEIEIQRKLVLEMVSNLKNLKDMICSYEISSMYTHEILDMDMLMCLMVEDAKLRFSDRNYDYTCPERDGTRVPNSVTYKNDLARSASENIASSLAPVSQQPMPEVVQRATETPLGLQPALAQIDSMAPNGYSSRGGSGGSLAESNMAIGAARSDIALRAGSAIAPVVSKIRDLASAASSGSSNRLGSSRPQSLKITSATPRSSTSKDTANLATESSLGLSSNMAIKKSNQNNDALKIANDVSAVDSKVGAANLNRNSLQGQEPANGLKANSKLPTSLNDSRSSYAVTGSDGNGLGTAPLSSVNVSEVAARISELKKPDEIRRFFSEESVGYTDFRQLIYESEDVRKMLNKCGIKVIGNNNKVAGKTTGTPKTIISDNGQKFIFARIGECEK